MSEWIEYTGSDEQKKELASAKHGFIVRWEDGKLSWPYSKQYTVEEVEAAWGKFTHYLICQPHPYAYMIQIWADTGCPVYIKIPSHLLLSYFYEYWDETKNYDFITATYPPVIVTDTPDWNIPGAEYSLTPSMQ